MTWSQYGAFGAAGASADQGGPASARAEAGGASASASASGSGSGSGSDSGSSSGSGSCTGAGGDAAVDRLAGEGAGEAAGAEAGVGPLPPGVPSFAVAQFCVPGAPRDLRLAVRRRAWGAAALLRHRPPARPPARPLRTRPVEIVGAAMRG